MTANFYITSGNGEDKVLPQSALKYVVEARVEQELSKPYRFAVRFEEDICGEFLENSTLCDLQPGRTIAIVVPEKNGHRCLVRGPITKVKTSIVTGGAGSWYEIHGEDNRHLLDLTEMSAAYEGAASEQVVAALARLPFDASNGDIERTIITYTTERPLQQSGTDLAFLNKIARDNNLEFWIEYEPVEGPFTDNVVSITENWFLRSSPRRPGTRMMSDSPLSDAALDAHVSSDLTIPLLSPDDDHALQVNAVNDGDCINTLSFTLDVDSERASVAFFTEVDASTGQLRTNEAFSPQPPTDDSDASPPEGSDEKLFRREALAEPVGSEEEQRLKAEAELTEKSWFVKATCSTAYHLINRVLFPHQNIKVAGAGAMHSGTYQITDVTHVIKPTAHMMDLKLRRNTINLSTVYCSDQSALPEVSNA